MNGALSTARAEASETLDGPALVDDTATSDLQVVNARLRQQVGAMQQLLRKGEERRRAMLHIMVDMDDANRRLADQRKAMLHILGDYESDRRELARQTQQLRNTRRALLHILQDSHGANQRLE